MRQSISTIALVVRDYDEAITWFTDKLGFTLEQDFPVGKKRWVVIAPRGGAGAWLLLARAEGPDQESRIGDQTGGRVFLFLETDDFDRDHAAMTAKGVRFLESPRREAYGTVAVFEDLCGNKWDLLQPKR
jgi:catechol 2,3-dioxygenase-like lactoylglutathione lyase family enzyme